MTDTPDSAARAAVDPGPVPRIPYWHVWTDDSGVSRQTRCEIDQFVSKSINPPSEPQWLDQLAAGDAVVQITVQAAGWTGTWHENPKPQWIIPISGAWFVQTMDGHRVEMGVGEISFGEDQNTRADAHGHRGHLSGTVGDQPAVLMLLQLQTAPKPASPCRFK